MRLTFDAVINQVLWTREVHSLSAALARPGGGLMLVKGATKGTQSSSMISKQQPSRDDECRCTCQITKNFEI